MPADVWLIIGAGVVGLAVLTTLLARIRSLGRRLGSFECALRPGGHAGWGSGIAAIGADTLDWYRVLSLMPRPERSWPRRALVVHERSYRLSGGRLTSVVELRCSAGREEFTLALSEPASAALTSWIEAVPPSGFRALG